MSTMLALPKCVKPILSHVWHLMVFLQENCETYNLDELYILCHMKCETMFIILGGYCTTHEFYGFLFSNTHRTPVAHST